MKETDLPEKFEANMKSMLGASYSEFKHSLSLESPISIRVNPRKAFHGETLDGVPWSKLGKVLDRRPVFTLDPLFHAGSYYVQEPSSMFLEQVFRQYVDVSRPLNVLDLCAAPGGKSTHILSLISQGSLLVSNEAIHSRTAALRENLEKWGHCNVLVTQNDPKDFRRLNGFFDVVVVDAPCSGEGLFRKDKNSIGQWSPENIALCSRRQKRILGDVWPSLKEGGILIYSTCTYNRIENEENLEWLQDNYKSEFLPLTIESSWGVEKVLQSKIEGYRFYPHRIHGEGFFLSVLRKKESCDPSYLKKVTSSVSKPDKSIMEKITQWVLQPEDKRFIQFQDHLYFIPSQKQIEFEFIAQNLRLATAGTFAVTIKRDKLVPQHPLALSLDLNLGAVEKVHLSETEALQYLRKESINAPDHIKGFAAVIYEGLPLGWVNVLPHRINNLYPSSRRIRMRLPFQDVS
jgi:16S rRNA C967 or C1407 C5-methylase (RsmB/RsmF family)/NOL1/NOP2/fmu family ribosome biogenesis protein